MNNKGLHVDFVEMDHQGNKTIASAEDLNTQITSLKNNMQELMNIWNGNAATQFQGAVEGQVTNLNQFKDLLNELGEKIVEGAKDFNATDEENAARANNLF